MNIEEQDQLIGKLVRGYRDSKTLHGALAMEIERVEGLLVTLGMALQDRRTDTGAGMMRNLSEKIDFAKVAVTLSEYDSLTEKLSRYHEHMGPQIASPMGQ